MKSIKLDDVRHENNKLWIGDRGELYYGPDEEHLICPEGLNTIGAFPPLTVVDLKKILQSNKSPERRTKRFLLFAGDMFYPWGGWGDFQGDFNTLEEAQVKAKKLNKAHHTNDFWAEIVDIETKEALNWIQSLS